MRKQSEISQDKNKILSKKDEILKKLSSHTQEEKGSQVLSSDTIAQFAREYTCSFLEMECFLLEHEIMPLRYQRNLGSFGFLGQKKILETRVAVIGCGGLGGIGAELLLRAGFEHLVLIDGDTFSESNLNRQIGSTEEFLGQNKAEVRRKQLLEINSHACIKVYKEMLTEENCAEFLEGVDVVFDALDSFSAREIVYTYAEEKEKIVVHGAIAGFHGQAALVLPENTVLKDFCINKGDGSQKDKGLEDKLANPTTSPSSIASLQVAMLIQYILGKKPVKEGVIFLDMENFEMDYLQVVD